MGGCPVLPHVGEVRVKARAIPPCSEFLQTGFVAAIPRVNAGLNFLFCEWMSEHLCHQLDT
jgi:hypothetical protein